MPVSVSLSLYVSVSLKTNGFGWASTFVVIRISSEKLNYFDDATRTEASKSD